MHLGIEMFATDYAIRPEELARACEERGFESLWFPEHTHIPASRRTPFPLGSDLPREYAIPVMPAQSPPRLTHADRVVAAARPPLWSVA
jgi:alkanesulfonate monooxygenase SsuD/methylene tetrahydromethanopterin reductase-like flavin-dependent oxidoreductase (luciferase family)